MSGIKKIAIAGGTGTVGSHVIKALIETNFEVTVLTRSKQPTLDRSIANTIEVDYNSVESLTSALNGQDAVVSTVGNFGIEGQKTLIDAAIAAGVKRFIPSEFSSCSLHPDVQSLPFYSSLAAIRKHLIDSSENGALSYTILGSGAFLDSILTAPIMLNFDTHSAVLVDGGNNRLSATSMAATGKAIARIFLNVDETKNRIVRISEVILTQSTLIDIAKEVNPNQEWNTSIAKSTELVQQSLEAFATGDASFPTLLKLISGTVLAGDRYGAAYDMTDNDLLGINLMTREELKKLVTERLNQVPLNGASNTH
ncbi:hypothetical protein V490_04806 [Pseudogymnoascus sp. VKM F-3557]|nr:hypothetical protein V490_04806 [Pseudogymnoascus sp. VKM F-3557]